MSVHYDALAVNRNICLDLPFREGVGALYTYDISKHRIPTTMVGAPAWTILDSYLNVLTLAGNDYIWGTAAETAIMNFTSVDYSLGGWFFFSSGGADDKTLMCRFLVSNSGWEMYHYPTNTSVTLRHHHAAGAALRSAVYSNGWAFNKWWFLGVSRHAATAQFWRGDIDGFGAITTIGSGNLEDPETCNQNLFIGTDTTGVNDYNGLIWRPRVWFERYLSEDDWAQIYYKEVEWFRS